MTQSGTFKLPDLILTFGADRRRGGAVVDSQSIYGPEGARKRERGEKEQQRLLGEVVRAVPLA